MGTFYTGLDLGQAQDYTALIIVERHEPPRDERKEPPVDPHAKPTYDVRHIERFPLGTSYPDVVAQVDKRLAASPLSDGVQLVVDATGVGRPVVDMLALVDAAWSPLPVLITGGDTTIFDRDTGMWRVPKRELVSIVQVLLQSKRLRFAEGLPLVSTLTDELLKFQVKINAKTAHDSYGAWREGQHDDLVLALSLALWYAERVGGPILFSVI